jgi:hypothetical protein
MHLSSKNYKFIKKKIKCNFTNFWVHKNLDCLNYKLNKNVKLLKYICKSVLIIKLFYLVTKY